MSQTPVKVPSSAASYTPATQDPDLRSQINVLLLREGHIAKYVAPSSYILSHTHPTTHPYKTPDPKLTLNHLQDPRAPPPLPQRAYLKLALRSANPRSRAPPLRRRNNIPSPSAARIKRRAPRHPRRRRLRNQRHGNKRRLERQQGQRHERQQ